VNTMNAGERTFIDLLPEGWKGPPPSLPMDVVKVGLLLDRGDVRRRRDDRIGEIEIEIGVEGHRELLLVEHGGDADAVGHLEHETYEGRLYRGAHADLRTLLGLGGGSLGAQR